MTSGNLDLVCGFYAACEAGQLKRALSMLAPEVEVCTRLETYAGVEAVAQMLEERLADWESEVDIRETLEPAPNVVVVSHHLRMRGLHTRIEASEDLVDVIYLRDGLICRTEVHASLEDALASVA